MLKITVELIPHGDELQKRTIGELIIVNDGAGDDKKGDYNFRLFGPELYGALDLWVKGKYRNFSRAKGYWSLIKEILNSTNTDYEKE